MCTIAIRRPLWLTGALLIQCVLAGCTAVRVVGHERGELVRTETRNQATQEAFTLEVVERPEPGRPLLAVAVSGTQRTTWEERKVYQEMEVREVRRYQLAPDFFLWPLYPVKAAAGVGACAVEVAAVGPAYAAQFSTGLAGTVWFCAYNPVCRAIVLVYPLMGAMAIGVPVLIIDDKAGQATMETVGRGVVAVTNPDLICYGLLGSERAEERKSDMDGDLIGFVGEAWSAALKDSWSLMWETGWVDGYFRTVVRPTWEFACRPFSPWFLRSAGDAQTEKRWTGATIAEEWASAQDGPPARFLPGEKMSLLLGRGGPVAVVSGDDGVARFDLAAAAADLKYDEEVRVRVEVERKTEPPALELAFPVRVLRAARKPTVELAEPAGRVARPGYVLRGKAVGDVPLTRVIVELNGLKQAEQEFSDRRTEAQFEERMLLRRGKNRITVRARDALGSESAEEIEVTFEPER